MQKIGHKYVNLQSYKIVTPWKNLKNLFTKTKLLNSH